jgi:hypothetical protein
VVVQVVADQMKDQPTTTLPVAVMCRALAPMEQVLMVRLDLDTVAAMAAGMEQEAEAGSEEQDKMVATHLVAEVT